MIHISKPTLFNKDGRAYMSARIVDEKQGVDEEIWYSTPEEYGKYFTPELSDAFLVGALMPAVRQQEDIVVDGVVTEALYHNISETIAPLIQNSFNVTAKTDGRNISWGGGIFLKINKIHDLSFNSDAVATGCSLGIDSFSTIEKYTSNDCPPGYRLTHLTFFNAGAYGSKNLDKARESYNHDLVLVRQFGERVGLPVVEIETNFALMYKDFQDYGDSGFLRNMSVVLSMQKLFKRYIYASTYQANDFKHGWGNYFYLAAKMFSTPNTDISISLPIQTRTDKTRMILNNPLSYEYLNVCWGYQYVDYGGSAFAEAKKKYVNCCICDKCLRTILTIDILGYKDKYASIFNLAQYEKVKNKYMGKVIGLKHKDQYYKEIHALMEQEHTPVPLKARLYALAYRLGLNYIIQRIRK